MYRRGPEGLGDKLSSLGPKGHPGVNGVQERAYPLSCWLPETGVRWLWCKLVRTAGVLRDNLYPIRPEGIYAPTWHKMCLFFEVVVYQMLMRGSTDGVKRFQVWPSMEDVPSLAKTRTYATPLTNSSWSVPALVEPSSISLLFSFTRIKKPHYKGPR